MVLSPEWQVFLEQEQQTKPKASLSFGASGSFSELTQTVLNAVNAVQQLPPAQPTQTGSWQQSNQVSAPTSYSPSQNVMQPVSPAWNTFAEEEAYRNQPDPFAQTGYQVPMSLGDYAQYSGMQPFELEQAMATRQPAYGWGPYLEQEAYNQQPDLLGQVPAWARQAVIDRQPTSQDLLGMRSGAADILNIVRNTLGPVVDANVTGLQARGNVSGAIYKSLPGTGISDPTEPIAPLAAASEFLGGLGRRVGENYARTRFAALPGTNGLPSAASGDPQVGGTLGYLAGRALVPENQLELAAELTPLGYLGDAMDIRRAITPPTRPLVDLPQGAAASLVRGTPVERGTDAATTLYGGRAGSVTPRIGPTAGAADDVPSRPASLPGTPAQDVARPPATPARQPAEGITAAPQQAPDSPILPREPLPEGQLPEGIEEARQIAEARAPRVFNVEAGTQPSAARRVAGTVAPGYKLPRQVLIADQARQAVDTRIADFVGPEKSAADQVMSAWQASRPRYVGEPGPMANSVVDYLERPWLYTDVSPDLQTAWRAWDEATAGSLTLARDRYGVDIDPFYPRGPNGERGAYVPHMESTDAIRSRQKAGQMGPEREIESTARVSVQKERGVPTVAERMSFDPMFSPETDLPTLATRHGAALTDAASRATYKELIPGKTAIELMEQAHPGLRQTRDRLNRVVTGLRDRIKRLDVEQRANVKAGRQSQRRVKEITERLDKIDQRIAGMGDEYGPELSFLSGQAYELRRAAQNAANLGQDATERLMKGIEQYDELVNRYLTAVENARTSRRIVRTADSTRVIDEHGNATQYVLDPVTNKWVTPDVARASSDVSKKGANGFVRALEEGRAIQLSTGDASPITFGRGILGAASHPGTAARFPFHVAAALANGDDIWKAVDQDMLRTYEMVRGAPVTKPLQEIRPDEARRGAERLPGIGGVVRDANDLVNRVATFSDFQAWQTSVNSIVRRKPNLTLQQAGAEATKALDNVTARVDLRKLGFSSRASRALNAPLTSLSYMGATPQFVGSFSRAMGNLTKNLVSGNPVNAWSKLGAAEQETIIHGIEMIGTLSTISAASAVMFDDDPTKSIEDKLKDAMNPASGDWWTLKLPGGRSLPLATPLRSFIRAGIRTVQGDENAGPRYIGNRLINLISWPVHTFGVNEDWTGDPIREGDLTDQIRQSILYGLESATILTSPAFRAARTGDASVPGSGGSLTEIGLEMLESQAGLSIYDPSPFDDANKLIRDDVKAGLLPETYIDAEGNPQPLNSYQQLTRQQQAEFNERHADNAAVREELSSEPIQALRSEQEIYEGRQIEVDALPFGDDWREGRRTIQAEQRGALDRVQRQYPDYFAKLDERDPTNLEDAALGDYVTAIEENTANGIVDWESVDRVIAGWDEPKRTALEESRLLSGTPKEQEYLGDIARLEPYFEVRDQAWETFKSGKPEFEQHASFDDYATALKDKAKDANPNVSPAAIDKAVDNALSDLQQQFGQQALAYLVKNRELVDLLYKHGFYVPAQLAPLVTPGAR